MLSSLYEYWENGGQLVYSDRHTYAYDVNNNVLSSQQDLLDFGQLHSYKFTYTYDTQSNMTSVWHYEWLDSTWIPKDTDSIF